ncbi:hypothetical protein UPYG_G00310350 [Umbra pygmaea]|uniref:Uncharacterized protein n=1 Tax=Umbra pygmaea TaxID=75934 RepID=A0ABD0WGG0_UMBPY
MIDHLLEELMGVKGRDLLGVPLLDEERMQHIWRIQRRHVRCIQDEPGVPLYTEVGCMTTKEGIVLPKYRCARGSTSLESFHCHLQRFIPGTSANSLNFQLYLLEGLNRWNQDRAHSALAVKPPSLLSYSGHLVQCVNTYSIKVLGKKLVPSFQPPAVYTGSDPIPTPATPEQQVAVDVQNIQGMDRVDSLAEYLVGLRNETGQTLSNQQTTTIVSLWQNLLPYDQQKVAYAARHQARLTVGRFKAPKRRAEFTPGVESMTRCVLGSSGSPAQWPDCCRLVETIFVKICQIYKSPKKQRKGMLSRWSLILNDYQKIRQLILGNGTGMQSTTLQLFEVNQTMLIQWHNKRLKKQDCSILLQGVNLPANIPVASVPLPAAQVRPIAAPLQPGLSHAYRLPESTAGQAVLKRKTSSLSSNSLPAVCPHLPTQQLFPMPAPLHSSEPLPFPHTPVNSPFIFVMPQASSPRPLAPACPLPPPPSTPRPYNRTVERNRCGQCGQPRSKVSGHSQYYGHVFCPKNANVSLEQWMEKMRRERTVKTKK